MPADASATVSTTLEAIGATAQTRTALAQALLDHPFWDGETWYFPGLGVPSADDAARGARQVLLCRGRYSPRAVPFQISAPYSALLAGALGAGG